MQRCKGSSSLDRIYYIPMEEKSKFSELIISYLSKELNTEDEAFLLDWINSSEENKEYYRLLSRTWNLLSMHRGLENLDIEQEWSYLKRGISDEQYNVSLNKEAGTPEVPISEAKLSGKSKHIYKIIFSVMAAASILLIIDSRWAFFNRKSNESHSETTSKINSGTIYRMHHEINTTGNLKKIELNDGTEVTLSENTELSYPIPFYPDKREIIISGRGFFKVAKDNKRPFTVIHGNISTTALGTEFTVSAYEKSEDIRVRLHEGKVVIKSVDSSAKKLKEDIYLLQGQELIYNKSTAMTTVWNFMTSKKAAVNRHSSEPVANDNPFIPKLEKGSWYMFNNQPLYEVFNHLEGIFEVDIVYSKKEISDIYFIGKFDKKDSLEIILKKITDLNNLKIAKKDNKYIITKR